jgi:predicted metal-dependent phosphoesterase TrpH
LSEKYNIKFISGIEFSVLHHRKELHLLGYGYDYANLILQDSIKKLREYREWWIGAIVERVNGKLRVDGVQLLTDTDITRIRRSAEGTVGRPHIAQYLVNRGLVRSVTEAFDKYLIDCDVPKKYLTMQNVRDLMSTADGRIFLAHPNGKHQSLRQFSPSMEAQLNVIDELLPFLDGIECYYPDHSINEARAFASYAKRKKKMISGGSDCHQEPIRLGTVLIPKDEEETIFTQFDRMH